MASGRVATAVLFFRCHQAALRLRSRETPATPERPHWICPTTWQWLGHARIGRPQIPHGRRPVAKLIIHRSLGGAPHGGFRFVIVGPQSSSIFLGGIFPDINQPYFWGSPMTMETSIHGDVIYHWCPMNGNIHWFPWVCEGLNATKRQVDCSSEEQS